MRYLLSVILAFAVLLGPYASADVGHAREHQSHSSMSPAPSHHAPMNHDSAPAQDDHSGLGHALAHCGSAFCAPTYTEPSEFTATGTALSHLVLKWSGDDSMLRSLYLESDPPVPRGGFSKT